MKPAGKDRRPVSAGSALFEVPSAVGDVEVAGVDGPLDGARPQGGVQRDHADGSVRPGIGTSLAEPCHHPLAQRWENTGRVATERCPGGPTSCHDGRGVAVGHDRRDRPAAVVRTVISSGPQTDAVTARSRSRMLGARLRLMVVRAVAGPPTAIGHVRGTAGHWTGILAGREVRASAVPLEHLMIAPVPADPAEGACQLDLAAGGGRRTRRPPPVAPTTSAPSVARQLITELSVAVIADRGLAQSKWTI